MDTSDHSSAQPSTIRQRAEFYWATAGWLWTNLCRQYWASIVVLIFLSAISAFGRIATFVGLVGGLTALLNSNTTEALAPSLPMLGTIGTIDLPHFAILLFSIASITALAQFLEGRHRLRLGERYAQLALKRIIDSLTAHHHHLLPIDKNQPHTTNISKMIGGEALILVRAVHAVTGLVFPLCLLLISTTAAIVLSWQLSAILLALIPLYVFFFISLNRRVARASARRDRHAPNFRRATNSVAAALALPQYAATLGNQLAYQHISSREAKRRINHLHDLLLNRYRVQSLNGALIALVVLLILGYLTFTDDLTLSQISRLAMFAIVVRFGTTAINGLTAAVASFSRFLPQFQNYVSFYKASNSQQGDNSFSVHSPHISPSERHSPTYSTDSTQLGISRTLLIIDSLPLTPQRLPVWWQALTNSPMPSDCFLVPRPSDVPDVPLINILTGTLSPSPPARREALRWLTNLELTSATLDPKTLLPLRWSQARLHLPPASQALVAAKPILDSCPQWTAINASTWAKLNPYSQSCLKGQTRSELLIVTDQEPLYVKEADLVVRLQQDNVDAIFPPDDLTMRPHHGRAMQDEAPEDDPLDSDDDLF
jgi:hypothetical protein